jgi:hypothetical protein
MDSVQGFAFHDFTAVDVDTAARSRQLEWEHPMVCASQGTGPFQRIAALILRLDRRLRLEISIDSAERVVASYASHDDVACDHLR